MIDYIFQNFEQSPRKPGTKPATRQGFLNNMFISSITEGKRIGNLVDYIQNGQFDKITNFPPELII